MKQHLFSVLTVLAIALLFLSMANVGAGHAQGPTVPREAGNVESVPGIGNLVVYDGSKPSIIGNVYYDGVDFGIGTLTPADDLHIYSTTDAKLLVDTTGDGPTDVAQIQLGTMGNGADPVNDSNTKGWDFLAYGFNYTTPSLQNDLRLRYYNGTGATDVIHFETNGNVGIGTTAPTEALEVDGNILASGSICDNSGCLASLGELLSQQQQKIAELQALVCGDHPEADACRQ